jgi:hypothetical protein
MSKRSNPQGQKSASEQSQLQDQLITACEQGDAKTVLSLCQQGAKPDLANSTGKHPFGAGVWGMNPEIVNELLKQTGRVAPMTWLECESHNLKWYKEVFIMSKFAPQTYGEWYQLLLKIEPSPFLRVYHLKCADDVWHDRDSSSWEMLKHVVKRWRVAGSCHYYWVTDVVRTTEAGYADYRIQIKQQIEIVMRKSLLMRTLQSIGLFKHGIDIVCDYALEEERTHTLGLP